MIADCRVNRCCRKISFEQIQDDSDDLKLIRSALVPDVVRGNVACDHNMVELKLA